LTNDREKGVTQAFVALANSLVDGFDVVDLLSGLTADCARLLDVASAGLLLADTNGVLHVIAASSETTRNLELFQLQRDEGPCLDSYRNGAPVSVADLNAEVERWPQFVAAATAAGFVSVHAVPMRLRDHRLGTLGLFGTRVGALTSEDLSLAQALAHVASVALVQDKAVADRDIVVEQLQTALSSRVVLEQAKGFLAQRGSLDMDDAFSALRSYARENNLRLTDLARAVVAREIAVELLLDSADARQSRRAPTN
jgi:hypothetical protein